MKKTTKVALVDFDCCNLASVGNMLSKIGVESFIAASGQSLEGATHIILPGVGAFDEGMQQIRERGFQVKLEELVAGGTPLLGICLGAQLLCTGSEEGISPGLGYIDARVVKFDQNRLGVRERIPNMGWLEVEPGQSSSLFLHYASTPRFYFVHSYHFDCNSVDQVLATATYGYPFPAAIGHQNVFGVQFHPEKSHNFGMQLLENFVYESLSCAG